MSNVLFSLSVLVTAVLAARWLGADAFGRFSLLLSAQVVVMTGVASSVGQVATKVVAELHEVDPKRLAAVLAMLSGVTWAVVLVASVALLLLPDVLAEWLLGPGAAASLVRLSLPCIAFAALATLQQGVLQGVGAFQSIAVVNTLRLLVGVGVLWFAVPRWGLAGAIISIGSAAGAAWLAGAWMLRDRRRAEGGPNVLAAIRREWPLLTGFALPSWLSGMAFVVAAWAGNLLLSRQADGLAEVGMFTVANQLGRSLLLFVPGALVTPFLVEMASAFGRGDSARLRHLLGRSALLTSGSALVPALGVAALGPWLLAWYGQSFVRGYSVLLVLLTSTVLAALTLSVNTALLARGRAWTVAMVTGAWMVVFLVSLWLLPVAGAYGLAMAYLLGYVAQVLVTWPLAWRSLRLSGAT